jgi:hypothetical protein
MFVCCVLSLVQRSPADCGASLCVIKKPRGRGGHSPCWAAEPEKIIIIIIIIITHTNSRPLHFKAYLMRSQLSSNFML